MAFSRLLSKALTEKEGTKSIGGLLSTADAPAKPTVNPYQLYTVTPGVAENQGESTGWAPDTYTVNQQYLDWINNNKGAAPSATAYWMPASATSYSGESGPSSPPTLAGGFWNEPDPDGNGWGSQLSSGLKDFMASPVAMPIIAMATAGTGLAANLGGSLGATGNAATALGNGLISGGTTLAAGGSVEDALKNGLLSGGISYGGATLLDSIGATPTTGLEAAQQVASGPIDVGGLGADSLAAINNLPNVGVGSSLANFVDTPISVGAADLSALAKVPEFNAPASGLMQAFQQAQAPIEVGPMSQEAQAAMNATPSIQPSGVVSSVKPDSSPIEAGPMSPEAQQAINNTPNVGGGGLLDSVKSAGADLSKWMKDNPTLGRLLLSGAGALLNTVGNGSSGSGGASAPVYGAPVQWNSSPTALGQATSGLLAPQVKQLNPQLPGLLGNPNSGAWRFMKG